MALHAFHLAGLVGLALISTDAVAQQVAGDRMSSYADGTLVTNGDVTTCPYTTVGSVSVNMRSHSYSLKELRPEEIGAKLRKSAKKMGADAVVLVTIGETHMTLTALRSTPVTGRAIKYVDAACAPRA